MKSFPRARVIAPALFLRAALLLVVLGFALAAAVPSARAAAAPLDESKVIYPKASGDAASSPATAAAGTFNITTLFGALVLAGGGVWLLLRNRQNRTAGRVSQTLAIDETKPLGNRQYLVVASYEGKKFLLGVCPGRIDMLSPLDGASVPAKSSR